MKIAIDFDRVINPHYRGWYNGEIYDDPPDHVRVGMQALYDAGHNVIIHTARTGSEDRDDAGIEEQKEMIDEWCNRNGIPYTKIWTGRGKPVAAVYVDDLCMFCDIRKESWQRLLGAFGLGDVLKGEGK